jgi:hypothetical protein
VRWDLGWWLIMISSGRCVSVLNTLLYACQELLIISGMLEDRRKRRLMGPTN